MGTWLILKTNLQKPQLAEIFVLFINLSFYLSKAKASANLFKSKTSEFCLPTHTLYLFVAPV